MIITVHRRTKKEKREQLEKWAEEAKKVFDLTPGQRRTIERSK